jgi:hypothetical protein
LWREVRVGTYVVIIINVVVITIVVIVIVIVMIIIFFVLIRIVWGNIRGEYQIIYGNLNIVT